MLPEFFSGSRTLRKSRCFMIMCLILDDVEKSLSRPVGSFPLAGLAVNGQLSG